MFDLSEVREIITEFGLSAERITKFYDTSRSDGDKRFNFILDDKYVLKINSETVMTEIRLREISVLISRYRSIGIYCPKLLPTLDGKLSLSIQCKKDKYICFVEEFAAYPVCDCEVEPERAEVVEHLGILASKFTDLDLIETKSMWSIIDLAPLDKGIDEKQENANLLIATLYKHGYSDLANRINALNNLAREKIMTVFDKLPRCVYHGDLNDSNLLHNNGHFAGLIDFNMSGTDVNINVFLNETNCFPEESEFDALSVSEIVRNMVERQDKLLTSIFKHYTLNNDEEYAFVYYRQIINLFQYPNVCAMVEWLNNDLRQSKCIDLITCLAKN